VTAQSRWTAAAPLVVALALVGGCASTRTAGSAPKTASQPPSSPAADSTIVSPVAPSERVTPTGVAPSPTTSYLSESSTAPSIRFPADGQYFCLRGLAICHDGVAMLDLATELSDYGTTVVPMSSGDISWLGVTLSTARQLVYYLQYQRVSDTSAVETIRRVSTEGGPPTTVVTAPLNTGGYSGVNLGAPQLSPDGRFLAYVLTVGVAGAKEYTMPVGAHIVVLDLASGTSAESPITVPESMTGPQLPDAIFGGYKLAGWSPDDRSLYYFGSPTHDLEVVTFGSTGRPVSARTLYRPDPPEGKCADGDELSAMTPAGDVLFTTYCQLHGVTIERLHDGAVTAFASVPELTGGWLVNQLFTDTTGRVVQLDEDALDVDCMAGTAHVVFLDSVVVAKQIQTNGQGCPPGAQPMPAPAS
jgi:hypothetical protein